MSEKAPACFEMPKETKHSANWGKWLWVGVSALAIVLVALTSWTFVADEPVADISDLREKYGQPLPTDARGLAWAKFVESLPKIVQFEDIDSARAMDEAFDEFALRPDDPLLKEYFSRNRNTLERTLAVLQGKEILEETAEVVPEYDLERGLSTVVKMSQLAPLLRHYVQSESEQGRGETSLRLQLAVLSEYNQSWLLRSNAVLVEGLSAMVADTFAMSPQENWLEDIDSGDACLQLIAAWEKRELDKQVFNRLFFHEILFQERMLLGEKASMMSLLFFEEFPPKSRFSLKPGATVNLTIRFFKEQELVDCADLPETVLPVQESLQMVKNAPEWGRLFMANYHGKWAMLRTAELASSVARTFAWHNARNRLLRTGLALRAYWLEHGEVLPPNLEMLVPEYLPTVPLDPFSEKPICYDREQKRIWLVANGEEMKLDWPQRKSGASGSLDGEPRMDMNRPE